MSQQHVNWERPIATTYYNNMIRRQLDIDRMRWNGEVALRGYGTPKQQNFDISGQMGADIGSRAMRPNYAGGVLPNKPLGNNPKLERFNPITRQLVHTQDNLYRVYKNYMSHIQLGQMRDKTYRRATDKFLKV